MKSVASNIPHRLSIKMARCRSRRRLPSRLPSRNEASGMERAAERPRNEASLSETPAFARLFEAVHEGVYIGAVTPDATTTVSANPHLKLMFGFAADTPEGDIRPFDADRFVDPQ